MVSATNSEVAWLAGLLEGEGSFFLQRRRSPCIRLQMVDKDVVVRAAALMGVGTRFVPRRRPNWSDQWKAAVQGHPALTVMAAVRPFMGNRRGADIDRLLNSEYAVEAAVRAVRRPYPSNLGESCDEIAAAIKRVNSAGFKTSSGMGLVLIHADDGTEACVDPEDPNWRQPA